MSVKTCVMCEGKDLKEVEVEIPIDNRSIKSVKVKAQKCSNCGEEYISGQDVKVVEEIVKTLNELAVGA